MDGAGASKVSELEFSDLYLGHPTLDAQFSDVPGAAANPLPAGPSLKEDVGRLTVACIVERDRSRSLGDFTVAYDGVNYRVSSLPARGGNVFVARKIADAVFSLAELGIPQAYIRRMMRRDLSGLFIVSGASKSGKTMTAGAMLKDRLGAHGGVAVTGENPVELPLEGNHGHGICFQTVLPREPGGCADAISGMLRWRAGTMLIGEIHDEESASALLKASFSGYLIITTMLADDVVQTVTKLNALLNARLGPENARALMADSLLGVLHQQMVRRARHPPRLETQFLFMKDAPATRALIRKGEFELLDAEIRRQMEAMISENRAAQWMPPG